jgi:hypothetical protein
MTRIALIVNLSPGDEALVGRRVKYLIVLHGCS